MHGLNDHVVQGIPEERHAEIEQNEWRKQDWCPENPTGNSCLLAGHVLSVAIAPLLWRLDHYGIQLDKDAAQLMKYAERLFSRPAYIEAMTPAEKAMRK